jgi:membrane protein DedA with SNARE-associated domain
VAIVAGLVRMNLLAFVMSFSAGVAIWNGLLLTGGYMLGENWQVILEWLQIYNVIVVSIIVCAILVLFMRSRKSN